MDDPYQDLTSEQQIEIVTKLKALIGEHYVLPKESLILISGLENAIADRREFYNESVNLNNVRVQQFPDLIVAKVFSFSELKLLQFASAELEDVDVSKHFNS